MHESDLQKSKKIVTFRLQRTKHQLPLTVSASTERINNKQTKQRQKNKSL